METDTPEWNPLAEQVPLGVEIRLEALRTKTTLKDISSSLGRSSNWASRRFGEKPTRQVTWPELVAVCRFLNVTPSEIAGRVETLKMKLRAVS